MIKRLLGILLLTALVSTSFATPVLADVDPLQKEADNLLVRTKLIPATNFYGEVSYQELKFVFGSNGNISVTCGDYSYQFVAPFAGATFTTYQNAIQVVRTYTYGKDTVTYTFGFDKFADKVNVDFTGTVSTGKVDINLLPITHTGNEFRVRGERVWVGQFDDKGNPTDGIYFDWSDATQSATVDQSKSTKKVSFEVAPDRAFSIDPTVGTSTGYAVGTGFPGQHKTVYANGRHWVFYSDGTNAVWRSSTDGENWSSASTLKAGLAFGAIGIYFDGVYFHSAYNSGDEQAIYYRRGTLSEDGTISWSAAEQTVITTAGNIRAMAPTITADSDGYPFIGYLLLNYTSPYSSQTQYAKVTKSKTNDGTWSDASGFPYTLRSGTGTLHSVAVVALTSGKVYAGYTSGTGSPYTLYGKLWDGSSWDSEETISSAAIQDRNYFSATALGDSVHIVYLKTSPYNIVYRNRAAGGSWDTEVTVQASTTATSCPAISLRDMTGGLIVFWAGSPTANHIYYKSRFSGTWDSSPTDWITETALTSNFYSSCFLQAYAGMVGLLYLTKTSSPYDVKYDFLVVTGPPIVTTDAATNIGATSARLNGTIVSDGGGLCRVRWGYGKSQEADFEDYTIKTSWTGYIHDTGDYPYYDAAGLDIDDTYHFRIQAENAYGTTTGDDQPFDTWDTVGDPSGLRAYPSATSVSLSWVKGEGATESVVRRKIGSYPETYTDGSPVYLGTSASCNDAGLERGKTYYYSVWARSGQYNSEFSSDVMTTTLASAAGGEGLETPTEPSRWMSAPNYENLANLPIIYGAVNNVADKMEMPRETAWMILAIAFATGAGILFYMITKKALVGLIVMTLGLAFGWTIKIVPFWIPMLTAIVVIAILFTQRREAA